MDFHARHLSPAWPHIHAPRPDELRDIEHACANVRDDAAFQKLSQGRSLDRNGWAESSAITTEKRLDWSNRILEQDGTQSETATVQVLLDSSFRSTSSFLIARASLSASRRNSVSTGLTR